MKRNLVMVLALMLGISMLTGCDDSSSTPSATSTNERGTTSTNVEPIAAVPFDPVPGELADAGNIRAICPDGWFFVPVRDLFSDEAGALDSNKVRFMKGTDDDWASVPYIVITFLGLNRVKMPYSVQKEYYGSSATDIEPFMIGTDVWEGLTYNVGDMSVEAVISKVGVADFDVLIVLETGGKTISFADADVQTILSTIDY